MAASNENMLGEVGAHHENDSPMLDMKMKFMNLLNKLLQNKGNNSEIFTKTKYSVLIEEVKLAKRTPKKESVDYRRLKKYDVIEVNGRETLIAPIKEGSCVILYYVHTEDLFDILHNTHLEIGHGGRVRMERELKTKYKNVTKEVITLYLRLCRPCRLKLSNSRKPPPPKPLLFAEFNSKCQVDLIDMKTKPDGEYNFILHYQDHLTKFVILRPLKSKTAHEVANQLLDIFTIIGAPCVLQSDNRKRFANQLVDELQKMWPELKMVHGKLNRGSVKRGNQDIQNMIVTWMETKRSQHWAEALRHVQFMKNRSYHRGIQKSPFEAVFGCKAKLGLGTTNLPREAIDGLVTEEDLETVQHTMEGVVNVGTTYTNVERSESSDWSCDDPPDMKVCAVCDKDCKMAFTCNACGQYLHELCGMSSVADEGCGRKIICWPCFNKRENSSKEQPEEKAAEVGDTILLRVSDDGLAREGVLAVVPKVEDGFYNPGTDHDILHERYCSLQENLALNSGSREEKSVGTDDSSPTDGEDRTRCHCTTQCGTNRCICKKKKQMCNSKCHRNSYCYNK